MLFFVRSKCISIKSGKDIHHGNFVWDVLQPPSLSKIDSRASHHLVIKNDTIY